MKFTSPSQNIFIRMFWILVFAWFFNSLKWISFYNWDILIIVIIFWNWKTFLMFTTDMVFPISQVLTSVVSLGLNNSLFVFYFLNLICCWMWYKSLQYDAEKSLCSKIYYILYCNKNIHTCLYIFLILLIFMWQRKELVYYFSICKFKFYTLNVPFYSVICLLCQHILLITLWLYKAKQLVFLALLFMAITM